MLPQHEVIIDQVLSPFDVLVLHPEYMGYVKHLSESTWRETGRTF